MSRLPDQITLTLPDGEPATYRLVSEEYRGPCPGCYMTARDRGESLEASMAAAEQNEVRLKAPGSGPIMRGTEVLSGLTATHQGCWHGEVKYSTWVSRGFVGMLPVSRRA